MAKFIGTKNNQICIVSNNFFANDKYNILEVPENICHIPSSDLMENYKIRQNEIIPKYGYLPAKTLKVALVGNYRMVCGISTYSENLWPEIIKNVGDYKLFIEENYTPTGPFNILNNIIIPDDKIAMCWKRGESLTNLVNEIKQYDPDVVWIQHEFGIWPNARYWLSMLNQLSNYRVVITMHSVFHHRDKTICEAAMPEIVVHLDAAMNVLKNEKQVSGKAYVIPHGCYKYDGEKLWNFYKSNHTVIQAGFLFRYKGWQESLKAISIIKNKYTDVFFTGICSESPFSKIEHRIYYNELMELIDELNIQENVSLIRGYQSDQVLDSFFKTNKVALFPYVSEPGHEVFGVSGAARMAMSKGLPVITTSVNHFSDLNTIKADTPEQIANELDRLFSNPLYAEQQIKNQIKYIEENSWEKVGQKYISIFENS